jgi:hypothetical protein
MLLLLYFLVSVLCVNVGSCLCSLYYYCCASASLFFLSLDVIILCIYLKNTKNMYAKVSSLLSKFYFIRTVLDLQLIVCTVILLNPTDCFYAVARP